MVNYEVNPDVLTPYLPYGLKMYWEELATNKPKEPWEMTCNSITFVIANQNKPLLYPLSYLTEDLDEQDNLHITALKGASDGSIHVDEFIDHIIDFYDKVDEVDFTQTPDQLMEYLFENHFDIFGLIEKGLAIDKSTLTNTETK